MLKKIALGIVMVGISGGLIYGAVNRTAARTGTRLGENGNSGSRGNQGRQDGEDIRATGRQNGAGRNNGNGNGGRGRNTTEESRAYSSGGGLAEVEAIYEIIGTVEFVNGDQMIIVDENNTQTIVENRAWRYALEAGFNAAINDQVRLSGFYDEGIFEAISLDNITQSIAVRIREESGRPLWAGGGGR
jgi:hypothetical protein